MTVHKHYRYCGRDFTHHEIEIIRKIVSQDPARTRAKISKLVCQNLQWVKPNGGLKDMSCRVAMLRMCQDGLISLPPARKTVPPNRVCRIEFTQNTVPGKPITEPVGKLEELRISLISKDQSGIWNEYIHRYHYLGYKRLPGAQLRYFVYSDASIIALLGFGAAAWKVAPRDQFIGWSHEKRQQKLHLIVNNARFLILPWVHSKNLASKTLAMVSRQLQADWLQRYNYQPVMLETFVQNDRFKGTCYKAANWKYLGKTKGRGKLDRLNVAGLPQKNIWVYPLRKNFRELLCS